MPRLAEVRKLTRDREAAATARQWQLIIIGVTLCLPLLDFIALLFFASLPSKQLEWLRIPMKSPGRSEMMSPMDSDMMSPRA
jgi:hypothetical protein